MRRVFALIVAVGIGACDRLQQLAESGNEPAGANESPDAGSTPLGSFAASGPLDVRVLGVEDPFVPTAGPRSKELESGTTRYVAVEVELVHRRGSDSQKYSYGKFHLYDRNGRAFESHYADDSVRAPHLVEGYLLPGKKAVGWVTFELPNEAEIDYVQFFLGYLDGEPVGLSLRDAE